MPFSIQETIGGLKHLGLKWQRRLTGASPTQYLEALAAAGVSCLTVSAKDGNPAVCHICGFVMVRADLPGGWLLETCSAVGLNSLPVESRLREWAAGLPLRTTGEPDRCLHTQEISCPPVKAALRLPGTPL
ncbi:MAG TPA: hypothetical protein V6D08_15180 [Candidatus Obscuribacterales bacterium]